ncbi:MAG: translocation/assembly module TamB domain-containing protein [Vicinamibacterales bacterium]
MASPAPLRVTARVLAKTVAAILILVVVALVAGVLVLRSSWGQERVRRLAVEQANRFLTATLEIGRLEGSLFGGVTLHDVRLARGNDDIVTIEQVDVAYSIRQFFGADIRIRDLRLVRPRVVIARDADGRWNLGALVRRREPQQASSTTRRPVLLQRIQVEDGLVELRDPLTVGVARVPTTYSSLEADLSFTLLDRGWRVDMTHVAWAGVAPFPADVRVAGGVGNTPDGWTFEELDVTTPQSAFIVDGRVDRTTQGSTLDLRVDANHFAFQEWGGILTALQNIAVQAQFDAVVQGPAREFSTAITLASDGGDVNGDLRINTEPPGWGVAGTAAIARLDLARWLNRPDRPSDVTGDTTFDLRFSQGSPFPQGTWAFDGTHAAFLEYETGELQAEGRISPAEVLIESGTTTAYGTNLRLISGSIGFESPFPFTFAGRANGLDLRLLPEQVPVPKVETLLALDFDVRGQFVEAFMDGRATFDESRFLDATIGAGAVGSLETSADPVSYAGEGDIRGLSLDRVASAFEIGWLSDPRYHGVISGRFGVDGAGSGATMSLASTGRLEEAALFGGTLSAADVTLNISDGSLSGSFDGRFADVNPAIAVDDERFGATVTATGRIDFEVDDLLIESPTIRDYHITADLDVEPSVVADLQIETATIAATLESGQVGGSLDARGPAFVLNASGGIALDESGTSSLEFEIPRADLAMIGRQTGRTMAGQLSTRGRLTGPGGTYQVEGTLTAADAMFDMLRFLGADGAYGLTIAVEGAEAQLTAGTFLGRLNLVHVRNEPIDGVTASLAYQRDGTLTGGIEIYGLRGVTGTVNGVARLAPDWSSAALSRFEFSLGDSTWGLVETTPPPVIAWDEGGVALDPMAFITAGDVTQRLTLDGTWRGSGGGELRITTQSVQIAALAAAAGQPDSYAGLVDLDATITGTREQPIVTGNLLVTNGRLRRLSYQQLFGRVVYVNGMFEIGVRLDQAPGVWLTASGAVPLGLLDRSQPVLPMHVAIASTPVSLGLIEGLTDVVSNVSGQVELDVSAVGTGHDPRFTGLVRLMDAGFRVASTGSTYHGGNGTITLTRDRMTVDNLQLLDASERLLSVQGSVGTDELRFQDLQLDVTSREFEILRNQYGTVDVDARLTLRGRVEAPVFAGTLTITDGELRVDRILDRMLFSPYAVEAAPVEAPVDAIAALNPWERLALDITLDVPGTLQMVGDNVQVATGTPLGLGNIDLRVAGNLFLRKEPAGELSVVGSLDELTGRYTFQGRRFDLDPSSTVAFSGDLDPELSVLVTREISGVQTQVTIAGRLSQPELRLASNPPLDPTDILSLIVFNTTVNELSAEQQEQLAVRAGTLAAGFLTAPLLAALERTLGLEILEIEAATTGARVTIGDEIAPGLVARFSRQFGADEYDEATIEYFLSRLFRIRATFSDAGSVVRSPFRRVERAGIDFLLFFSF